MTDIREEVVSEGVSRRDMLRKAAVGAGLGAAAITAPSIAGLGIAPAYGQNVSGICSNRDGCVTISLDVGAANLNPSLEVTTTEGIAAADNCFATIMVPDFGTGATLIIGTAIATNPDTLETEPVPFGVPLTAGADTELVFNVPCGFSFVVQELILIGGTLTPIDIESTNVAIACTPDP